VRNRKDMTFLVRWKWYTGSKDDTWESYDNVRQTQAFVDYCTEQKMRSLVSKKTCYKTRISCSRALESYARFSFFLGVCTTHLGFGEFSR
jgi:hypothetical protein